MADSYIHVTHEDFAEKVLNSPNLVIVNFSAEQSDACKIQDDELKVISGEFGENVTFARLIANEQSDFTREWKVESIPTLLFFKNGKEVHRITGIIMRERLRRQIEGVLLAN